MSTVIERANAALEGKPASEAVESLLAEGRERCGELLEAAKAARARIERPKTVEDATQAEQDLKRIQTEDGILQRLIGELPRAQTQARAREAVATADADRKALTEAVRKAAEARRVADNALMEAQRIAARVEDAKAAATAPEARRVPGIGGVGADRGTAARLADLMDMRAGPRNLWLRKITRPETMKKAG